MVALCGACSGGGAEAPAAPVAGAPAPTDVDRGAGTPAATDLDGSSDPGRTPSAELQVALVVQLELRTHLLVALASGRTGDEAVGAAAAGGPALAARRRGVTSALRAAGVEDTGALERALAAGDDLVLAHVDAGPGDVAPDLVARHAGVARRSAAAWSDLTAGRLPVDVAEPMVAAHLGALVAVVDGARRHGVASAASVAGSVASTERLVAALASSLSVELGLAGDLAGDAADLRRELASTVVLDAFAAAADAAGLTADPVQAELATDRLVGVVQRHYGPDLAVRTGAVWVVAHEDAAAVQDALRRLEGAPPGPDRDASAVAVAGARRRAERSAGDLAAALAEVVGDRSLAPVIERALDDHRSWLEALTIAGAELTGPARWRSTADAALGLTGLAAVLAQAITRHKSLA